MNQNNNRISIQVGLSGYSFRLKTDSDVRSFEWMSADRVFTTPELQGRYDDVEISVLTPKTALVPEQFFVEKEMRETLSSVCKVSVSDHIRYVNVPEYKAVLVYSNSIGESLSKVITETVVKSDGTKSDPLPEHYFMLKSLSDMTEYNKIVASYMDGHLYLVIAQGNSLLLCNSFKAPDFTTAEYFIFLAMKKLQLNPEISTISFRTPLDHEQEMSLYRYFKSVELI